VAVDDERTHADAQYDRGEGIPSQPDEQREGRSRCERSYRDHPGYRKPRGKDDDGHQHGQGRHREKDPQGRGHALAPFKTQIEGEAVSQKGGQAHGGDPRLFPSQPQGDDDGDQALEHVAEQGDGTEDLACGAHDIGGADVAAALLTRIDPRQGLGEEQARGYGAQEIGEDHEENIKKH